MKLNSNLNVLCVPKVNNAFFTKLCEGLGKCGCNVSFKSKQFWENPLKFNVLHIHFPEAFYEWENRESIFNATNSANQFIERLQYIQNSGVKIIWTVHNLGSHDPLYPKLDKKVYNALIECCDGIILQSNRAKSLLEDAYPKSLGKITKVIQHINYTDSYPNQISRQEARGLLDLKDNSFVYLYLGQIRPYKDIFFLLKAFSITLKEAKQDIVLLIAGRLSLKFKKRERFLLKINAFFRRRVILKAEFIPNNDLQNYLNATDVCVFSYKKVFMSGAVILAQSFGVPVIAPDTGCIPDYVNEKFGFLYKKGDASDLSKKMLQAIDCDLSKMKKAARTFQLKNDYISIAEQTVEFYLELLNK